MCQNPFGLWGTEHAIRPRFPSAANRVTSAQRNRELTLPARRSVAELVIQNDEFSLSDLNSAV